MLDSWESISWWLRVLSWDDLCEWVSLIERNSCLTCCHCRRRIPLALICLTTASAKWKISNASCSLSQLRLREQYVVKNIYSRTHSGVISSRQLKKGSWCFQKRPIGTRRKSYSFEESAKNINLPTNQHNI